MRNLVNRRPWAGACCLINRFLIPDLQLTFTCAKKTRNVHIQIVQRGSDELERLISDLVEYCTIHEQ